MSLPSKTVPLSIVLDTHRIEEWQLDGIDCGWGDKDQITLFPLWRIFRFCNLKIEVEKDIYVIMEE